MAIEFRNRTWGGDAETLAWMRQEGIVLVAADELEHETLSRGALNGQHDVPSCGAFTGPHDTPMCGVFTGNATPLVAHARDQVAQTV